MMVKALTNFVKRYVPRPIIDHLIYLIYYKFIKRNYFAQNSLEKKIILTSISCHTMIIYFLIVKPQI